MCISSWINALFYLFIYCHWLYFFIYEIASRIVCLRLEKSRSNDKYVIAPARDQLRVNFSCIFKVFTKLPESRCEAEMLRVKLGAFNLAFAFLFSASAHKNKEKRFDKFSKVSWKHFSVATVSLNVLVLRPFQLYKEKKQTAVTNIIHRQRMVAFSCLLDVSYATTYIFRSEWL